MQANISTTELAWFERREAAIRATQHEPEPRPTAAFGLMYDNVEMCIRIGGPAGIPVYPTATECRISEILLEWPGRVIPHRELAIRAFGREYVESGDWAHILRVNVSRIRGRIAPYLGAGGVEGRRLARRAIAARQGLGYYVLSAANPWALAGPDMLARIMWVTQLLMPGAGVLDAEDSELLAIGAPIKKASYGSNELALPSSTAINGKSEEVKE